MRPLAICCCLLSLLVVAACGGRSGSSLPDRDGHALVVGAPAAGGAARPAAASPSAGVVQHGGQPGPGEQLVTVEYGDALYKIAKRHDVELRWLIERNDLIARVQPGDQLVVPAYRR